MVGRRPILGGSSRERHVGPQDGLESGLMNLLLRQNSNAQLSSQGRASEIKNPSRIIRRRSIHLLAQNQVFERIFWTTMAAAKIDYFATLGHVFQCKIDADSDFAIKRVLKLWSDWTLAVQRNTPNNDLLRLHRIWLDQKRSIFVIHQPKLICLWQFLFSQQDECFSWATIFLRVFAVFELPGQKSQTVKIAKHTSNFG